MKCNNALDVVYQMEDTVPLWTRLNLAFHIIFCGSCAARLQTYEEARSLLRSDFFPPSPDFTNAIMNRIYREAAAEETEDERALEIGGFSTKGWIIAGLVMLVSLATVFFGKDFVSVARDQGSSFLLPLGLITGMAITGYGALFIGSHLKELSERFKL